MHQPEDAAAIAHLIRNRLTVIKGYCSTLLQMDAGWSPEVQQELELIVKEADAVNELVKTCSMKRGGRASGRL